MINTTITPITYKEAANLLNVRYFNIRDAANDGRLTRLQTVGQQQKLIKEQTELFKNKTQIRYTMLSDEEKRLWQLYNDIAQNKIPNTQETYSHNEVAKLLASTIDAYVNINDDENKTELISNLLLIAGILTTSLGFKWLLENKQYIVEKLIKYNAIIKIDNTILEELTNEILRLGTNPNPDTVVDIILNEIAA